MKFLPLRALAIFNPEKFSEDMLNTVIERLNGNEYQASIILHNKYSITRNPLLKRVTALPDSFLRTVRAIKSI